MKMARTPTHKIIQEAIIREGVLTPVLNTHPVPLVFLCFLRSRLAQLRSGPFPSGGQEAPVARLLCPILSTSPIGGAPCWGCARGGLLMAAPCKALAKAAGDPRNQASLEATQDGRKLDQETHSAHTHPQGLSMGGIAGRANLQNTLQNAKSY